MFRSTSELRVRLAPLNWFKPSSKIFYWPFQGGSSFVDLLCFCSVLCLLCFVRACVYVLCGHLLGKGWPLGSRLCCLLWVCHFPIGILGQVWYLIVSFPDLCNLTYFQHNTTVVPNKRNSDVIFCLQLLSKILTCTLHLSLRESIDHLCINPILRIGFIHKWIIEYESLISL